MRNPILLGMMVAALGLSLACASTRTAQTYSPVSTHGAGSMEPAETEETAEEAEARRHAEWVAQPWNDGLQP
jgi:hypothetical protein